MLLSAKAVLIAGVSTSAVLVSFAFTGAFFLIAFFKEAKPAKGLTALVLDTFLVDSLPLILLIILHYSPSLSEDNPR